jgi:hypothetical protein
VFGAVVAAGWLAWAVLAAPIIGLWDASALYLIGATAVSVVTLAGSTGGRPSVSRRITAALAVSVVAALLALCARTTTELCVALAVVFGVARSAFLYRAAPARAVATELVLLVGGLLFARFLAGSSLLSWAIALWGFLLVQSFFFLVPGVHPRAAAVRGDPFEEAHRRATALLERSGV